jgi:hypothetical protein
MITTKATQKIFTYTEAASLTGICPDHLDSLAKRHRLGFIARATEIQGSRTDQWFFGPWDLMVLATLFPRCAH